MEIKFVGVRTWFCGRNSVEKVLFRSSIAHRLLFHHFFV